MAISNYGLASVGIGVLKTIGGVITFPFEIFDILFSPGTDTTPMGFYPSLVPDILATLIGLIVVLAVAVLLISAKLGFDFT